MKKTYLLFTLIFLVYFGRTQNIDSLFSEPQEIDLTISTPQPRLEETFQIAIYINHLRANIFKSLAGKVQLSGEGNSTNNGQLTMQVRALNKGKNELGPIEFYLNKTKYRTNKLVFDVIEPLPNTDNGLWFRLLKTSDNTFSIIIEQRIPAINKTTQTSENSVSITTEPEYTDIVKFKDSYSIDGVSSHNSYVNTNFSSIEINGEKKQFMYAYSVYHFEIENKNVKIRITKDKFVNLPANYKFEDIEVQ